MGIAHRVDGDVVDSDEVGNRPALALARLRSRQENLAVVDELGISDERVESGEPVVEEQQRGIGRAAVGITVERVDRRERVGRVLGVFEAVDQPRCFLPSAALLDHHDETFADADHLAEAGPRFTRHRLVDQRQ